MGCKFVLGSYDWIHDRGVVFAPDFITIDGSEGGAGFVTQPADSY